MLEAAGLGGQILNKQQRQAQTNQKSSHGCCCTRIGCRRAFAGLGINPSAAGLKKGVVLGLEATAGTGRERIWIPRRPRRGCGYIRVPTSGV